MKVKINEYENYEITFPDKIDVQTFLGLVSHLVEIQRMLSKNVFSTVSQQDVSLSTKREYTKSGKYTKEKLTGVRKNAEARKFNKSREEALRLLILNYYGTKEDKEAISEEYNNTPWEKIQSAFSYTRKKWKIQPQEIGITHFPLKAEMGRKDTLKLKDFDYKKSIQNLQDTINKNATVNTNKEEEKEEE